MAATERKYLGSLVEYLDQGKLRTALVVREQGGKVAVLEGEGREKTIERDLVLLRHAERGVTPAELAGAAAAIRAERERLAAELDLELLWEVVREQGGGFSAAELTELFFGTRSTAATAVVLEALLGDRLHFSRRHLEFVANQPEQVERVRLQQERIRLRSESYRKTQSLMRRVMGGEAVAPDEHSAALAADLRRYLANPASRNRDLTTMLSQTAAELAPAETAYEILERLGQAPLEPRFAAIAGLRSEFGAAAREEARRMAPVARARLEGGFAITIDDEETVEVDDALSCEPLPDGAMRLRVHIALVADLVAKDGALDREAAARAATVYLPEATIRMLPDEISCGRASLLAGSERPALTTDIRLSAAGEIESCSIYPALIKIARRLSYEQVNNLLEGGAEKDAAGRKALCTGEGEEPRATLRRLHEMAALLRERRRRAGAVMFQRREAKVRVQGDSIEVEVVDAHSPARLLVAEFMVLSNFVAARFAAENSLPIIYRVQPGTGDFAMQRPRLSLYPDFHAGIGLNCYAQFSSPIRRYADLVLQRQMVGGPSAAPYRTDELMAVLANAENAEAEAKELERRAKRYWILRYLQRHRMDHPLEAIALREGASAELTAYTVRGALRGAPGSANDVPVMVRIARVDPLRGSLALDYIGPQAARPAAGSPPHSPQAG